ncbi:MAG TPA: hypothetical protein VH518_18250 [Tepidisphaeraceae bacterium]|jgi:hypothetical protein
MSDPAVVPNCAFCGKPAQRAVEALSGAHACWDCLLQARTVLAQMQQAYQCNFCGEGVPANAVVEGPNGLHMCAACVESGIKLLSKTP